MQYYTAIQPLYRYVVCNVPGSNTDFSLIKRCFKLLCVQDSVVLDHLLSPEPADLDLYGIKERF